MAGTLVCSVCFAGTENHPGLDAMRAAAAAAEETPFAPGADDAAALKQLAKQAGEAAQLLKMLANEKRLLILCFLAVRGEMTVGELVGVVKLSQSALSQHYRVADPRALRLLQVLKEIYCGELK